EFGATTGRPRRCGWIDLVVLRYAARVNGLWGWALTKLDVLSGIEELRLCTGYKLDGEILTELPGDGDDLARGEPIYESMPGWTESLEGVRSVEELPPAARAYIDRIVELSGVPVKSISVGPDRAQSMLLEIALEAGAAA